MSNKVSSRLNFSLGLSFATAILRVVFLDRDDSTFRLGAAWLRFGRFLGRAVTSRLKVNLACDTHRLAVLQRSALGELSLESIVQSH